MSERPILMSGPMVRAILREVNPKTQTRRIVKPQPAVKTVTWGCTAGQGFGFSFGGGPRISCPFGDPGDQLWVKETWRYHDWTEDGEPFVEYAADGTVKLCTELDEVWREKTGDIWAKLSVRENFRIDGRAADRKWRPSIHMPRWASRITLKIADVRVECLQDISEEDAIAEGASPHRPEPENFSCRAYPWEPHKVGFSLLWDSLNGKRPGASWADNPWVWAITFERMPS